MNYLALRFDVDTHKCIKVGVRNLTNLAKKHNAKFTFYVNAGKSVDPYSSLITMFNSGRQVDSKQTAPSLSALKKLGVYEYLYAAIINPVVSDYGSDEIRLLLSHGHEIGLHGGKNHELWYQKFDNWSMKNIESEVMWGLEKLRALGVSHIPGFASPHWKSNKNLAKILKNNGFSYFSDVHGTKRVQVGKNMIDSVSVNISGEPGGVGYFEYCSASGMKDSEVISDLFSRVDSAKYSIVYDHPYYAGVEKIDLIEKVLIYAKKNKVQIITVDKLRSKIKK